MRPGTYRKRGTHANYLDILLQQQQFGDHELQKIAPVLVVKHVQLVENHNSQVPNATFFDCGVY